MAMPLLANALPQSDISVFNTCFFTFRSTSQLFDDADYICQFLTVRFGVYVFFLSFLRDGAQNRCFKSWFYKRRWN